MERDLRGKTAVVTGGAKGIGYHIADKFLENEAQNVILLDVDDDAGIKAASVLKSKYGKNKSLYLKCDVVKDLEVVSNEILNMFKTVDILVNNAAIVNENSVKENFAVNATAVIEWSMKFFESMRKDLGGKGGTIINISSIYGFRCDPYAPFYTASKHAVLGFSKSQGHASTFAKTGVRIVAICPGFTRTNLVKDILNSSSEEIRRLLKTMTLQEPDVVGEAAVEVFRKADSGTAWIVENGNPVVPAP